MELRFGFHNIYSTSPHWSVSWLVLLLIYVFLAIVSQLEKNIILGLEKKYRDIQRKKIL